MEETERALETSETGALEQDPFCQDVDVEPPLDTNGPSYDNEHDRKYSEEPFGLRPRYSTILDLDRAREAAGYENMSINMRDVADGSGNRIRKGLLFRSSQVISSDDLDYHNINLVFDLRVPPAPCKVNTDNQMQRLNRWLTRIVVWFRHFLFGKRDKLPRLNTVLMVDEYTLHEYPKCIRCTKQSKDIYGITPMDIYHIDLLPSYVEYWIFYELPFYIKAKILWMKIKGNNPENYVANAIADDNILGFIKLYQIILSGSKRRIARCFRLFLQYDNLPAIVHCIHGKDRTGLFVMLVYLLCGVPREEIIKDYSISYALLREGRENRKLDSLPEPLTTDAVMASSEYVMEAILDYFHDIYGDVSSYLMSGGITAEELGILKSTFLV